MNIRCKQNRLSYAITTTIALGAILSSASSLAWVNDVRIRPDNPITVTSNDPEFNHAMSQSIDYVYDSLVVGPQQYPNTETQRRITMFPEAGLSAIPSYWGSYHGTPNPSANGYREAWCLRDIAHQTEGASLLSLNEETITMLEKFAADALADKRVDVNAGGFDPLNPEATARTKSFWQKYWTLWSYNFYGFPYYMDAGFQELPAPYELLEKVYAMYLASGDPRWLSDTFLNYGRMLHTQFTEVYDFNGNGIADNRGKGGILPTLWEFEGASHLSEQYLTYDNSTNPATLVIDKQYFQDLGVQDLNLKVRLRNGKDDYLSVRVNNLTHADGSLPRLNRDFILVNVRNSIVDQEVGLNLPQGVSLTSVSDGAKLLTAGSDYELVDGVVVIKASYLTNIKNTKSSEIKSAFIFDFSDGSKAQSVVQLTYRSVSPMLDQHEVSLDWNAMADISLSLDLTGQSGNTDLYRIENNMARVVEAGDTLGVQYQALLAMSGLLNAKAATLDGAAKQTMQAEAAEYQTEAERILQVFRTDWYSEELATYARAFDGYGNPIYGWGHENSFFMPMKDLLEPGTKADAYLSFIHTKATDNRLNEEAITYLPEAFYNYGKNSEGWYWLEEGLKRFYSNRTDEQIQRTYPEIAFTNVSNVVTHMMGFTPRVDLNKVITLSRLTSALEYVEAVDLPVGQGAMNTADYVRPTSNLVTIKHQGQHTSTFSNKAGSEKTLTWQAQFEGLHTYLYVEGAAQLATQVTVNGVDVSYVDVAVAPSETKTVTTVAPPARIELSSLSADSATADWGVVKTNLSTDGNPLRIGGNTYSTGLGTHANSDIVYLLDGQYKRFTAQVGVDDEVGEYGSVIFFVYLDGVKQFDSGIVRGSDAAKAVDLDISSVNELKLVVDNAGDGMSHDHADWADAYLSR